MSTKVLFLCTGNYYRSRYAEIMFNLMAAGAALPLEATSRGVATELGVDNVGPLSPHVERILRQRNLRHASASRFPLQVAERDFEAADLVIALDEQEHRPMMRQRYPPWADRIEYWQVQDLWATTPDVALAAIEARVRDLIARLAPA